jgi:nucleotide-binding universal stress UspA family protein
VTTVIAAIDNSPAARPVLAAASELAAVLHADVEALHVREDGDRIAAAAARAAHVPLKETFDPTVESLVAAARSLDVSALVLGARAIPAVKSPLGHVALEVITSLAKPLVLVPPDVRLPFALRRILVPLDGTRETAEALAETMELACGSSVEVVVLHVYDERTLPPFSDQPQHETAAWEQEFLARFCPRIPDGLRLELRLGAPGESVVRVADQVGADLVALGWSQDLSPGHAAVVREVLRRSRVPVLLVPVQRSER